MLYLVLLLTACSCWIALDTRRALYRMYAEITQVKQQLQRMQESQQQTFEFVYDAVNEFAIISGETKEEDIDRERLSDRILDLRRSLNDMGKKARSSAEEE
jgi:septal ring factor EnvC (AmiA/AmiB activator)